MTPPTPTATVQAGPGITAGFSVRPQPPRLFDPLRAPRCLWCGRLVLPSEVGGTLLDPPGLICQPCTRRGPGATFKAEQNPSERVNQEA